MKISRFFSPSGHRGLNHAEWTRERFFGIFLQGCLAILFMLLVTRRAWLSDDAYITFRTVDNFVNGYRLTWNTIERVQAYTHPLWMFLLSGVYGITRNMYMTGIGLSLGVSFLAVILFAGKAARSLAGSLLGLAILCLSGSYVDYSTSGLENPLSHLLLVLFLVVYYRRQNRPLFLLSLLASLAGMTRLDLLLVYLPVLVACFLMEITPQNWLRRVWLAAAGMFPLILWEAFSLFYYGFPFPNTAYAKLNTGMAAGVLWTQGLYYIWNVIERDPLTPLIIMFSLIASIVLPEVRKGIGDRQLLRNPHLPVVLGMLFYLVYLVKIGGDFMSGRFFTPLVLTAAVLVGRIRFEDFRTERGQQVVFAVLGMVILVFGVVIAPNPTYLVEDNGRDPLIDESGIANERLWYFDDLGLRNVLAKGGEPVLEARTKALALREEAEGDMLIQVMGNTGVFGYYAGPNVYIIDQYALSDALLARLPAIREVDWRIGHFRRVIPEGYVAQIYALGKIGDPRLELFYQKLSLITRGRLADPSRLSEIWRMNTGNYDNLIDTDAYRYPDMVKTTLLQLDELADPVPGPADGDSPDSLRFMDAGVSIYLGGTRQAERMGICLEMNDVYLLEFWHESEILTEVTRKASGSADELVCYHVSVPKRAVTRGYDHIRVFPLDGNGVYSLGHIRLSESP